MAETVWTVKGQRIAESVTVSSKGTFAVTRNAAAFLGGGSYTLECAASGKDVLLLHGEGEITSRTFSACKVTASTNSHCTTSSSVLVEAKGLPWHIALVTSGSATREQITGHGGNKPRLRVECAIINAEAEGNTSAGLSTVAGGVDETFDSSSEEITKWNDGSTVGKLGGTELLENPSGGALSFERLWGWRGGAGEWIEASEIVSATGSLKFVADFSSFAGGGFAEIVCGESSEGTVGKEGLGEVKGVTLTGCKVTSSDNVICPSGSSAKVFPLHLPWHTTLVAAGSTARDSIGKMGWEIYCESGTHFAGEGASSMGLANVSEGVESAFDESSARLTWEAALVSTVNVQGSELLKGGAGLEFALTS